MADQWMLSGVEYSNCNCAYGCGCQFNAPTTHGFCEAMASGHIEEGYFNATRLDGLNFVMLLQWPGEVAQGNGTQQMLIDLRANYYRQYKREAPTPKLGEHYDGHVKAMRALWNHLKQMENITGFGIYKGVKID